jgi:MFS family permease
MTTFETIKPWLQFFHPIIMWLLLAGTLYALYLGMQARKTRLADADTRKELIKGKFGIRHHQVGAILLAFMVLGTIGGMAATYINNGKLFVGPHLLVGLGMTGLIATSAALVPFMQKGNETARLTHISLNVLLVGLFGWQALTGMQIVQRILDNF